MRKLLIAIALGALVFGSGDALASKISQDAAANVCKGKAANGQGGCSWCGKTSCGTITCEKGKDGQCYLTYTKQGKQPQ